MKRILAAAVLILCLPLCGCAKEEPVREPQEIVRDIIRTQGADPDAEQKLTELFSELKRADAGQEQLWRQITDYWSFCDSMAIHENELPDGLPEDNTLGIVILGYALKPDGSMQDELVGRLTTALRCAEQYPEAILICTGGGTASDNSRATEAGQMTEWLEAHGIPGTRILTEDRSLSTVENAVLTLALMERKQPQITDVAIVSSEYHIAWGSLLFEAVFLESAASGETERHVITNAAYPFVNESYQDTRGYQISGLLSLAGRTKQQERRE